MEKIKKNKSKDSYRVVAVVATVVFSIYAFTLLLPFAWGILASLKTGGEYLMGAFFPKSPQFSNYAKAFTQLTAGDNNLFYMIFNSLWYATGHSICAIAVCSITAYACAKYDFFLGKLVYVLSLAVMIIPFTGNLAAQVRLARILHTYDTPLTLFTSLGGIGFNTLLMYSFYRNIDKEYAEAAFIDGAGHMTVFLRIMFPLAISPMIALFMQNFIGLWNDAEGPLVFLPSYPTLSTGLYIYQTEASRTLNMPVLFAGLIISAVPCMILYLFCHKNIASLQFGGGIKG